MFLIFSNLVRELTSVRTIWELVWLSAFCWVALMFLLPETSATNILYRRTRRLRKLTGNDKLISEPELASANMTGKDIAMIALVPVSYTHLTLPTKRIV